MRPAAHQKGFTLIEVMMAIAIVAIMTALIWASFGRLLNVTNDLEAQDAYWQSVRVAMNRMAREVSAAFISDDYDPNRYRQDDPEGRPTFFMIQDRGENDRLAFTAFVNRRLYLDEKTSDEAIVDYTLDRDENGQTNLYRRQKNIIDEDWDRGGEKDVLIENVTGFDVEWWDPDDETWRREWDTRRTDEHDHLPSRIKITLKVKDPDGKEQTFVTQTRIELTYPLAWGG